MDGVGALVDALAVGGLSGHGVVLLIMTAVVFALFVWDRLPIASVCLGILVFLPLLFRLAPYQPATGQAAVDPSSFFFGFGHPALIAISALMVMGQALVVTGALEPLARKLSGLVAERPGVALVVVLLGAAAVSGFVNDTPVVVLLIPLLIAAMRRAKASPATALMPMNYAVLIGGMATTIGTSTNLIVVSMAETAGLPRMGMLSFYPLVAAAAVPALLYLWLVAPRLLRSVEAPADNYAQDAFDAELRVEEGSWLDGKELREANEATDGRMRILDLRDERGVSRARLPTARLRAGDRLVVQDTVEHLKEFEGALKASLHGLEDDEDDEARGAAAQEAAAGAEKPSQDAKAEQPRRKSASAIVAQIVITPQSPLVGRSVKQQRLSDQYRLAVLGLRPAQAASSWSRKDVVERTLHAGDILLVQGSSSTLQEAQRDGIGLLLDSRYVVPRQNKANAALLTLAAVVGLAATKTVPIEIAALGGVMMMLVVGALTWRDISGALSAKVVLLVAASLALGSALSVTGATAFLAQQLVQVSSSLDPRWVLVLLMGLMGLFTNFVSNNAAAAIGTPMGIELARQLGVPPEPYVLAVLFGCNLCYLTPMGYQTNLLVMNAAGYRFADFVRVGTPLFVLMWAGLSAALLWRYGLG